MLAPLRPPELEDGEPLEALIREARRDGESGPSRMRVSGHEVTIVGRRISVALPPRKTVTVRVS
jgi:hypothetical protein